MAWKFVGINFDHMHMLDLLRCVQAHPNAEVAGICDEQPERMQNTIEALGLPQEKVFTDYQQCLETTRPDFAIICSSTGEHALWTQRAAAYGVHVIVEKPFASSLADADAMIEAVRGTGKMLVINWPLAWYAPYLTTKRVLDEGTIGDLIEVHHYGGNRGPLSSTLDTRGLTTEEANARKSESWWYQKEKGGGSLLDYIGYGVTLGTWFHNGRKPLEVTCVVDQPVGLEVDEHSVTVARYETGLSKFETRWGTFTDPWVMQPQPKCGFVLVGTRGTIAAYDYDQSIRVQTEAHPEGFEIPNDKVEPPMQNPVQHLIDVLENGTPLHKLISPEIGRIGQQIVDSAVLSARKNRTVGLLP